jgi:hypothetical protein
MIDVVELKEHVALADYARLVHLAPGVRDLRSEAELFVPTGPRVDPG